MSGSHWWRWPLVPISAVIGAAIVSVLVFQIQWFSMKFHGGYTTDGWTYRYVLPAVSAAVFGWAYTYISCTVAPAAKVITGTVMTAILILFNISMVLLAWNLPNFQLFSASQYTIECLISSTTSIYTLISVRREEAMR